MRAIRLVMYAVVLTASLVSKVQADNAPAWKTDLEAARQEAIRTNRLLLVHCWTPSCGPCRAMEQTVFADPNVAHTLSQHYVTVKLNLQEDPQFGRQYGIRTIPTDVVIKPDGTLIDRTNSPRTSETYIGRFQHVAQAVAARENSGNPVAEGAAPAPAVAAQQGVPQPSSQPNSPGSAPAGTPPQVAGQTPSSNLVGDRYKNHPLVNNQFAGRYGNETPSAPPLVPPTGQPPLLDRPNHDYRNAGPSDQQDTTNGSREGLASPGSNPAGSAQPQFGPGNQAAPQPGMSQPGLNPHGVLAPYQPQQRPDAARDTTPPAGSTPAASSHPSGLQLPPGVPPLAFDGYCVVSVRDDETWRMGNPAWGVIHRGQTYLFHSQEAQQEFRRRPDYYGLVLNGHDLVHYVETGQTVPGAREFGATHKSGGVFLFTSEANLQRFQNDPSKYISQLQQLQAAQPQQR